MPPAAGIEDDGSRICDWGDTREVVARARASPSNAGSEVAVLETLDGDGGRVSGTVSADRCDQMVVKSLVNS